MDLVEEAERVGGEDGFGAESDEVVVEGTVGVVGSDGLGVQCARVEGVGLWPR